MILGLMNIQENISLQRFNTFGIDKNARFFLVAKNLEDLKSGIKWAQLKNIQILILGGGSNILFTKDFDGLVIKMELRGVQILSENEDDILVEVGAGEVWNDWVMYAISKGWGGIENLSLIPGTVGASPMQNIGAYGVEIKEVFHSLKALEINNLEERIFNGEECNFGYRESVFKHELKDKFIILSVTFRLSKKPVYHTEYGAIQETLKEQGIEKLSIKAISDAIISIRRSKLPDPKEIGNAGSFFKNPTISKGQFEELKKTHPDLPGYPNENGVKVPAGWLIEKAGWRGKKIGEVGVHSKQALVLVNYGKGSGIEIKSLSTLIQNSVMEQFGIILNPEVNFI